MKNFTLLVANVMLFKWYIELLFLFLIFFYFLRETVVQ